VRKRESREVRKPGRTKVSVHEFRIKPGFKSSLAPNKIL
jgi:hypothetical protein